MRKLDPQLEYLAEGGADEAAATQSIEVAAQFGLEAVPTKSKARKPKIEASVLVQYAGDPAALIKAGMNVQGISGDVVTGRIAIDDLAKLAKLDEVERIEAARPMQAELDLSVPEIRADLVHAGPPGRRGAGVLVGIVDTGCDYTHPAFQNSDGTTRILNIWDQGLTPAGGEASPTGFGFGVEYSEANINAALVSANPFNVVRHTDPFLHGTHVTGISAGNGSGSSPTQPAGTFVGVAPEADIIIVANRSNGSEGLGTSANTLDAVNYIFQRAEALDRPCVINMSLGDNLGPHDGTSLLERGLDNLLGPEGRAFVKSAGNAGTARVHAQGNVATGATVNVRFNQPGGDLFANQIDLWYEGGDTFRISVVDPAGNVVGPVNVGNSPNLNLPGGNQVRIDHRNNDPFNGDKRVFMTFARGTAGAIQSGSWQIRIRSVSSATGGRFDAWIQRGSSTNPVPQFLSPHESNAMTISTPGTAREVITAANYSARGFSAGSLTASSSRGPTRDGRAAPTLAAPGTSVFAPRAEFGAGDPYFPLSGTSMSAPHITGTIALMFQKNRNRTQEQIRDCLTSTARQDGNTGPVPNTAWGAGKLDAKAAVDCVPNPIAPSVPAFTCVGSLVGCPSTLTRCVSVPFISCRRSVVTACISVPRTTCLRPSVVPATCPSRFTICPSVAGPACPNSTVTVCNSVPAISCGRPQQSLVRCPSLVDDCPSTPGGCFSPGPFVDPNAPTRVNPNVGPGGFRPFRPDESAEGYYESGYFGHSEQEWTFEDDAAADEPVEIELPPEGYFEYDDSWFDE